MILKSAMGRLENITYQQIQVREVIYDCEVRADTNQVSVLFCSEGKKKKWITRMRCSRVFQNESQASVMTPEYVNTIMEAILWLVVLEANDKNKKSIVEIGQLLERNFGSSN